MTKSEFWFMKPAFLNLISDFWIHENSMQSFETLWFFFNSNGNKHLWDVLFSCCICFCTSICIFLLWWFPKFEFRNMKSFLRNLIYVVSVFAPLFVFSSPVIWRLLSIFLCTTSNISLHNFKYFFAQLQSSAGKKACSSHNHIVVWISFWFSLICQLIGFLSDSP